MTSPFRRSALTTSPSRVNKSCDCWSFFSFTLWHAVHCCTSIFQVTSEPVWEMCSSFTVVWVQEPQSEIFVLATRSSFKVLMRGQHLSPCLKRCCESWKVMSEWHLCACTMSYVAFQEVDPVWTDEVSHSTAAEVSGKGDHWWEEQAASAIYWLSQLWWDLLQNRQVLKLCVIAKK